MSKTIRTVEVGNSAASYYAPATIATTSGPLIHVAGQGGTTKDGHVPADYESQIYLALLNLRKVIVAAGAAVSDIAALTLFIVDYDASQRKHVRPIENFLKGHRPAMTLVPVPALAVPGWLFEINAVVAAPVPAPAPAPTTLALALPAPPKNTADVIVIGGGLAGLSAAHDVLRRGLSCILLEARDRVGGRTWSVPNADGRGVVDVGAAWINDTNQSRAYALAQRYGAELIVQNTEGNCVLQDAQGACSTFAYGDLPPFDAATRATVATIRDMVEADCQAVDAWRPRDAALDALTFAAYLRQRGADEASVATATVWTRAMLGQEPSDISALYFLNYCKSGGGLLQMRSDRKDGGQYLRLRQGTQLLASGLARDLPGGVLRLSAPVQAVRQDATSGAGVAVATRDGAVYAARKVISTLPGRALPTVDFAPALPPLKSAWADSLTYGYYTKAMMEFRSPFWVPRGYCGLVQSFAGPASVIRDTCSPADAKHVLTCFMAGAPGRAWAALSGPEREKALLAQIRAAFGVQDDLSGEFVRMTTYEWVHDEFAGWGCPCTALPPGVLDAFGGDGLRDAFGGVHFAGTETAGEWKGYMEGAIRSGERAAGEVAKDLLSGPAARL